MWCVDSATYLRASARPCFTNTKDLLIFLRKSAWNMTTVGDASSSSLVRSTHLFSNKPARNCYPALVIKCLTLLWSYYSSGSDHTFSWYSRLRLFEKYQGCRSGDGTRDKNASDFRRNKKARRTYGGSSTSGSTRRRSSASLSPVRLQS